MLICIPRCHVIELIVLVPTFVSTSAYGMWFACYAAGGCSLGTGRNSGVGAIACCDQLRCTKCDCRVISFNDIEWRLEVNYMFFRNNYPIDSKLAEQWLQRPSMRAYCCQCSWASAKEATKLQLTDDLRWICSGHSS